MRGYPRPLAVGLLQIDPQAGQAEHSRARIALALHANDEGYALVETFENEDSSEEEAGLQALEELAVRLDADALIWAGSVNLERIRDAADRARLMIIDPVRSAIP